MAKTKKAHTTKGEAEKLYKAARSAPSLPTEEVEQLEEALLTPERRAALGVLSMPSEELFSKIETDRDAAETFALTAEGVRCYVKEQRVILDMLNSARVRIEIALCARVDCGEVRAAGTAQYAGDSK